MRLFILTILLLRCWIFELSAQYYNQQENFLKANSVWCFGSNAGLNFNIGSPPSTFQSEITFGGGTASVADPVTGELLFYTNGQNVWNSNHQIMPNGNMLLTRMPPVYMNEYNAQTQGVCVVPVIGSPGKYYVFYKGFPPGTDYFLSRTNYFNLASLCYSVVDMSFNNGLGDVIPWLKNVPLSNDTFSRGGMIAIPGNNCDIWLLVHKYRHPEFLAYHITEKGIDTIPVVSVAGTQIQGDSTFHWPPYSPQNEVAYTEVTMAVSPNREYIALTSITGGNGYYTSTDLAGILLCRFNPTTGIVSDGIRVNHELPPGFIPPFSIQIAGNIPAFSPDNTKLYVPLIIEQLIYPYGIWHHSLVQYDVSNYDSLAIASSVVTIRDSIPYNIHLRLYNDSIYITSSQRYSYSIYDLHRINQPNLVGQACDFQKSFLNLFPDYSYWPFPNEIVYPLLPDTLFQTALDTVVCTKNGEAFRQFRISAEAGYSGYLWSDGNNNRDRMIRQPGIYWVLSEDKCHSRVDTFKVRHTDIPLHLGSDTAVCNGVPLVLKLTGYPAGTQFRWQDNSTSDQYIVNSSGKYWVEIEWESCILFDTINIVLTDVAQHLGEDSAICKGQSIRLNLQANVPERASVLWSTGATTAAISITDAGNYWVQVSEPPCVGSDTIRIYHELCTCNILMPNAFTPNADGTNDVFLPYIEPGCMIDQFSLHIYNRYGQRVYTSYNNSVGWNGLHNGALADAGTYFYEVSFVAGTHKERIYKKGDLTLLR